MATTKLFEKPWEALKLKVESEKKTFSFALSLNSKFIVKNGPCIVSEVPRIFYRLFYSFEQELIFIFLGIQRVQEI